MKIKAQRTKENKHLKMLLHRILLLVVFLFGALASAEIDQACRFFYSKKRFSELASHVVFADEYALTKQRSEAVLGRRISPKLLDRIYRSHLVGLGDPGKNQELPSQPGNYTLSQLREKLNILASDQTTETALSKLEIRKLFDKAVVGVGLPSWTTLPPRTQFEKYGIMVADWRPNLSSRQIEEMYRQVNKSNRHPYGEITTSSPKEFFFIFDRDTALSLQKYYDQMEAFAGRTAANILFRTDESRQQVFRGHFHDMRSHSSSIVALDGSGPFFRFGGVDYVIDTNETVYLKDYPNPIFHGTPFYRGRRMIMVINWETNFSDFQ